MRQLHTSVFPKACQTAHIRDHDLNHFEKTVNLNYLNAASHIAQLRLGQRSIGLAPLRVYPEDQEVFIYFIEIAKSVRGTKLSLKLLRGVFDFASSMAQQSENHVFITTSCFTDKGQRSIFPTIGALNEEYKDRNISFAATLST